MEERTNTEGPGASAKHTWDSRPPPRGRPRAGSSAGAARTIGPQKCSRKTSVSVWSQLVQFINNNSSDCVWKLMELLRSPARHRSKTKGSEYGWVCIRHEKQPLSGFSAAGLHFTIDANSLISCQYTGLRFLSVCPELQGGGTAGIGVTCGLSTEKIRDGGELQRNFLRFQSQKLGKQGCVKAVFLPHSKWKIVLVRQGTVLILTTLDTYLIECMQVTSPL